APVDVVAYSLGARLALGLLAHHAALVRRATLIGVNPGLREPAERSARQRRDDAWAQRLRDEGLASFFAAWQAQSVLQHAASVDPTHLAAEERVRLSHDVPSLARALEVTSLGRMPDYGPALAGIDVPVCLVVGEGDEKFLGIARTMTPELRRGEMALVPRSGHNPLVDNPAWLARLLERLHEENR
ncbi:MAG: alpha/beta fold hydrolase, partial [Myxococcota bacterium]